MRLNQEFSLTVAHYIAIFGLIPVNIEVFSENFRSYLSPNSMGGMSFDVHLYGIM